MGIPLSPLFQLKEALKLYRGEGKGASPSVNQIILAPNTDTDNGFAPLPYPIPPILDHKITVNRLI